MILFVFAGLTPPPVQRAPSPGQMRGLSSSQNQAISAATFYPPPTGYSPSMSRGQGQAPMGPNFSYNPGAHPPAYPQYLAQPMQMSPQSSMMARASLQAPLQAPLEAPLQAPQQASLQAPLQASLQAPLYPSDTYTGTEAMMMHQQVGTH